MDYRAQIFLLVVLFVVSMGYLIYLSAEPGLDMDIDFKGGTQITAQFQNPTIDIAEVESITEEYGANVRASITGSSIFITFDASIEPQEVMDSLREAGYAIKDYSVQTVGPSLGMAFLQQAMFVIGFAFVFMAVVVFIIFRNPVPCFYLVLCSFADIVETLSLSQFLGIELSLATFTSLLLLLGYSVDDNILLTTKVLKSGGKDVKADIRRAMKTGFTMTIATMAALSGLFLISTSPIITQIASVLLIGLVFDLLNTWFLNAPLVKWYLERKKA